jgi:ketosteroid isomerase-like protein
MMDSSSLPLQMQLDRWFQAWAKYDLEGVLDFCHDEILFENWTGARVQGKKQLRRAWSGWFSNPDGFRFICEELWIAADESRATFRWVLEWPSRETGGQRERRRGIDLLIFSDGLIREKVTYSKTVVEIDGRLHPLTSG